MSDFVRLVERTNTFALYIKELILPFAQLVSVILSLLCGICFIVGSFYLTGSDFQVFHYGPNDMRIPASAWVVDCDDFPNIPEVLDYYEIATPLSQAANGTWFDNDNHIITELTSISPAAESLLVFQLIFSMILYAALKIFMADEKLSWVWYGLAYLTSNLTSFPFRQLGYLKKGNVTQHEPDTYCSFIFAASYYDAYYEMTIVIITTLVLYCVLTIVMGKDRQDTVTGYHRLEVRCSKQEWTVYAFNIMLLLMFIFSTVIPVLSIGLYNIGINVHGIWSGIIEMGFFSYANLILFGESEDGDFNIYVFTSWVTLASSVVDLFNTGIRALGDVVDPEEREENSEPRRDCCTDCGYFFELICLLNLGMHKLIVKCISFVNYLFKILVTAPVFFRCAMCTQGVAFIMLAGGFIWAATYELAEFHYTTLELDPRRATVFVHGTCANNTYFPSVENMDQNDEENPLIDRLNDFYQINTDYDAELSLVVDQDRPWFIGAMLVLFLLVWVWLRVSATAQMYAAFQKEKFYPLYMTIFCLMSNFVSFPLRYIGAVMQNFTSSTNDDDDSTADYSCDWLFAADWKEVSNGLIITTFLVMCVQVIFTWIVGQRYTVAGETFVSFKDRKVCCCTFERCPPKESGRTIYNSITLPLQAFYMIVPVLVLGIATAVESDLPDEYYDSLGDSQQWLSWLIQLTLTTDFVNYFGEKVSWFYITAIVQAVLVSFDIVFLVRGLLDALEVMAKETDYYDMFNSAAAMKDNNEKSADVFEGKQIDGANGEYIALEDAAVGIIESVHNI